MRRSGDGHRAFPGAAKPATMTGVSDAHGAAERFTADERRALSPYFTNLDDGVFALRNLPEVVKGALFARYSRSAKPLRRLFLDEFLDAVAGGRAPDAAVGGRAGGPPLRAGVRRLRRRLGGPARRGAHRVRGGVEPADQGDRARPPGRVPRAVDPLRAVHGPARRPLEILGSPGARRASPARAVRLDPGRRVRNLSPVARAGAGPFSAPVSQHRGRLGGRVPCGDPGEGARYAARAAARRHPVQRGHLRVGPGVRGPAAADAGPPAGGGARVRGPGCSSS